MKRIGIIAEYSSANETHVATSRAIEHSSQALGVAVGYDWVGTDDIGDDFFQTYDGLWVGTASPYKNMERALWAIREARERRVPTFGTCGGFQHMIIEYARNLLGIEDAQHAESDPYASKLIISQLACSLAGREMELTFAAGSRVERIYGSAKATESYYCNFSVNPDYLDAIGKGPINISGSDSEGEARVIEHPDHPFYIGTLFVPQTRSTERTPHPLVSAFVSAVVNG